MTCPITPSQMAHAPRRGWFQERSSYYLLYLDCWRDNGISKINQQAMDLRRQYEVKEKHLYGSPSTDEDMVQGLAGDVNNLGKLVMAEHGKLKIPNSKEKLESQLSHCLWSVIVIAKIHNIDLE